MLLYPDSFFNLSLHNWKYTVLKRGSIYSVIQQWTDGILQVSGLEYKAPERKGYKGGQYKPLQQEKKGTISDGVCEG